MFITRKAHDEVVGVLRETIAQLKAQVAKLEEDRERTVDILAGRALGVTVYGRIVPPREEPEPEEKEPEIPLHLRQVPTQVSEAREERGTKARGMVRKIQSENLQAAEEAQREADAVLEMARQVGRERAMAGASNGNGNH